MIETPSYALVGGHRAVDLVNTIGGSLEKPIETVHTYSHLVAWTEQAGLLAPAAAAALRAVGAERPEHAASVLADARRLRGHLDEVLRAALADEPAPPAALEAIRDAYLDGMRPASLERTGTERAYAWSRPAPDGDLAGVLWPIGPLAVDLLTSSDLMHRLAGCEGCRWLFLDLSRNHSRRWCTMDGCGAHAKMRRHRASKSDKPASTSDKSVSGSKETAASSRGA